MQMILLYYYWKRSCATVTGEAFGNSDCIRISYAASEDEIKTAVERIKNTLIKN